MIRHLAITVAFVAALAAGKRGNADLKSFRSGDVDPDRDKLGACSVSHRRDLSENCRHAVDAYQVGGHP
jgi:hypothetical protein